MTATLSPTAGGSSGLQPLDERQRLPDAVEVVAFVRHVEIGAPFPLRARSRRPRQRALAGAPSPLASRGGTPLRARRAAVLRRAAARSSADTARSRSGRARRPPRARRRRSRRSLAPRALRPQRALPGRRPRRRRACRSRSAAGRSSRAVRVCPLGRVALERADLDRRPSLVDQDAILLAEHLDRADARAGPAEDVLGEDRSVRPSRDRLRRWPRRSPGRRRPPGSR